ncbi:MAG: integrase arm-type DNA-binding domain-containing protein [Alphaproteobacteria bacterium]|nr:integrase arm-type DNA-binding domain-containing protein [Alphaproteobacteria bacterium]
MADSSKNTKQMRLTVLQIERLHVSGKHPVGDGLYLQITGTGTKSWLFRYRLRGRRREMGLGPFPLIGTAAARETVLDCRRRLAASRDPLEERRTAVREANRPAAKTFNALAIEYIAAHKAGWRNPKSAAQWQASLDTYAAPHIGNVAVDAITLDDVMAVLTPIWRTKTETASRVRGRIEAILNYARVHGYRSGDNPARWRGHLDQLLPAKTRVRKPKHHAAIAIDKMPAAMTALAKAKGPASLIVRFTALTAARISEVVGAVWSEIDLKRAVWTVPAVRTKTHAPHRVPLSTQALAVLKTAIAIKQDERVFPGFARGRPLSLTGAMQALRRATPSSPGITVHGLRSTFRDWCAERGEDRTLAELSLSHVVGDETEQAYARSDLLDRRRLLMQRWADFACRGAKTTLRRR